MSRILLKALIVLVAGHDLIILAVAWLWLDDVRGAAHGHTLWLDLAFMLVIGAALTLTTWVLWRHSSRLRQLAESLYSLLQAKGK